LTVVAPLLVIVVAARTANLAAAPRDTGAWAAVASWRANITPTERPVINPHTLKVLTLLPFVFVIGFLASDVYLFAAANCLQKERRRVLVLTQFCPKPAIRSFRAGHFQDCEARAHQAVRIVFV
jgi:hypothetical protein